MLPERLTDRTIVLDRDGPSVPVYDAKMTAELEDRQGRGLWSGKLQPRFWGSRYVSGSIVNQAAPAHCSRFA